MKITTIGSDLAKMLQVHGVDKHGKVVRRKLPKGKVD